MPLSVLLWTPPSGVYPVLVFFSPDCCSPAPPPLPARCATAAACYHPQLLVLKQEKVAALVDVEARISMLDPFTVDTKPHGHGDVHAVLHRNGLPQRWLTEGRRHVVFLQDTNAIAFVCLLSALGVSAEKALEVCVCGERGRR